jgi:hypothetical protein
MDAGKVLSWQTGGDVWHQDYFIVTLKPHFNVMDEPDYRVTKHIPKFRPQAGPLEAAV